MEMRQVEYFLAAAKHGAFNRAAPQCGVTQPSLTYAIRTLELELGAALFRRGRLGSELTEFGRRLAPIFEQIAECAASMRREADDFLNMKKMIIQTSVDLQPAPKFARRAFRDADNRS